MELWNNIYFGILEKQDCDPEKYGIQSNRFTLDHHRTELILKEVLTHYSIITKSSSKEKQAINTDIFLSHIINLYNNCMLKPDKVVSNINEFRQFVEK